MSRQYSAAEYAAKHGLATPEDHLAHAGKLARSIGKVWTRERMIAHWHSVLDAPKCHAAREMAAQALASLHADYEREPGEDDF